MRRIAKACNLSTEYKTWHDDFEQGGQDHPKYTSSRHRYYLDVVMNLFSCQGGLCAYTEMPLCPPEAYDSANWVNGRYEGHNPQIKGQLEHFDSSLKVSKGWLWDNFFMVDTDINNRVKKQLVVDCILKPDREGYDEFELLEYNSSMHIFHARTSLSVELQNRINTMIETLGINYGIVKSERRSFLMELLADIEFEMKTWDRIVPHKFPTAFEMMKREHDAQIIAADEGD